MMSFPNRSAVDRIVSVLTGGLRPEAGDVAARQLGHVELVGVLESDQRPRGPVQVIGGGERPVSAERRHGTQRL